MKIFSKWIHLHSFIEGKRRVKLGIFLICVGIIIIGAGIFILSSVLSEDRKDEILEEATPVTIAVFGDSIWDIERGDTGIANQFIKLLDEKITLYDCTIMGTAATMLTSEDSEFWNQQGLIAITEEITGSGQTVIPTEKAAASLVSSVDFQQVDYFILAYGLNDYFNGVLRESDDPYDINTYGGALRKAITMLQDTYPQAKIIVMSQTYCQQYSYGKIVSDSNTKDFGGGTGLEYVETAKKVATEEGAYFINNCADLNFNRLNGKKYLSDATHLTEKGRYRYASNLAKHFLNILEESR